MTPKNKHRKKKKLIEKQLKNTNILVITMNLSHDIQQTIHLIVHKTLKSSQHTRAPRRVVVSSRDRSPRPRGKEIIRVSEINRRSEGEDSIIWYRCLNLDHRDVCITVVFRETSHQGMHTIHHGIHRGKRIEHSLGFHNLRFYVDQSLILCESILYV